MDGRPGPRHLLRGVLDIPPAAVEANDDGARRVCWRAEAAGSLVGEAMLGTERLERGILQRLHLDLHLIDAMSHMEIIEKSCERRRVESLNKIIVDGFSV